MEIEKLFHLLSFGCMWLPNGEHRDPESVSFLQISAVFLAITAATGSLLGHHGKRWVRPLYAPGRPLWFVPEELSYCDTKLCRYFWRKKLLLPKCSVDGTAVRHISKMWEPPGSEISGLNSISWMGNAWLFLLTKNHRTIMFFPWKPPAN